MATFSADMAKFGRRLADIVRDKDVPALQTLVLDMCQYRDDMVGATIPQYKVLTATIDACNGTLWSIHLHQLRTAA